MLSKILEKSGISSEVKIPPTVSSQSQSVGKGELIQPCELQRHDYGNIHRVSNCEIRKSECNDPNSQKKIDDFQKMNADNLRGYRINEDKNSFQVVRKSRRGYTYTNRIDRRTVEEVYLFLKNGGRELPVSEIEKELSVSNGLVYNALKVLQSRGKVHCQPTTEAGKHRFMYKAT
jgi:hypothetical protein